MQGMAVAEATYARVAGATKSGTLRRRFQPPATLLAHRLWIVAALDSALASAGLFRGNQEMIDETKHRTA